MSDGRDRAFDPQGEARGVLQSAVSDFGARVLSNAAILEGICEDRIPELPREASLIASAAKGDVAGMLAQQVGGVGPDAAVRLTAATLADSRSLDPAACVWVVGEFARCLGFVVSEDLAPANPGRQQAPVIPPPTPAPGPAPVSPAPAPAPAPVAPATQRVVPGPAQPTFPPGPVNPAFPPGPSNETYVPPGPVPGPGPFPGPVPGPFPPAPAPGPATATKSKAGGKSLAGVGAALVVAYLVIAGAASLPPFGPNPSPTPSPTPPASSSPSPARSFQPTQADLTLSGLIPSSIKSAGQCTYRTPQLGAAAQVNCANISSGPAAYVNYYLFGDGPTLSTAYGDVLSQYAGVSQGYGNCGSFKAFTTCETPYGPGSTTVGRMAEYLYQSNPDITWTDPTHLLLMDSQGASGDSLVTWWAQLPSPWLAVTP